MEDDDEFGDLYSDVLTTFPSSSSSASHLPSSTSLFSRPVDLNLQSDNSNSNFAPLQKPDKLPSSIVANDCSLPSNSNPEDRCGRQQKESVGASENRGFDPPAAQESATRVLQTADLNLAVDDPKDAAFLDKQDGAKLDIIGASKDGAFDVDKEQKFGTEEQLNGAMEDLGSEPIIPGLDTGPASSALGLVNRDNLGSRRDDVGGEGDDDWDSDSEDDLQIVLNDNNHVGMGMESNGMMMMVGSDDEDEDGEPLVIVADGDAAHQPTEGQDWVDDVGQPTDGKEMTDASKPNGVIAPAPKLGYSSYGYHPFNSQFKYVRPGAAPLPGGPPVGSGGGPGQVGPAVNMATVAGRGRGDWRPPGLKCGPMQKGFHPGFWGSNVPGRGLEFTLPSHKTIFEVDIDSFEEKPWKHPGVDIAVFFNFGLNEESWKEYCKQLQQLRLEATMQSKIRVYESGRAEQDYDPDLPPELAAAAAIHDSSAENARADGGFALPRPPLPTGRAIPVETGYGERLPSVDTRPARVRDSDTIIEIVLQDSMDVESDASEHLENVSAREDDKVDVVDEGGSQDGDEYLDGYPRAHCHIKEGVGGKRSPIMDSHDDIGDGERDKSPPQRASSDYHPGSRGQDPTDNVGSPHQERLSKEKAREISPHMSSGESAQYRRSLEYQREDSTESMEGRHSPRSSSPPSTKDARKSSLEERAAPDDRKPRKGEEDTSKDKCRLHSKKQQKLRCPVDPESTREVDDTVDFKASWSSDNSKETGSSRGDHQKWREGVDEEVVQKGLSSTSTYTGHPKRRHGEGELDLRRKHHEGRMETERNYMLAKGREEYFPHGNYRDPYGASPLHLKSDDQRKGRDYSEVSWQRRDEDPRGNWIPRQSRKVREIDTSDKDEYLRSRKLLDNGNWRGYHDKDPGLRNRAKDDSFNSRQKDDSFNSRHKILDDHHSKRRKDGEHVNRDHVEKEEILLAHKGSSSTRRQRERDEILNPRKRDEQPRVRENMDGHHSVGLKDEFWVQKERAEQQREKEAWYRSKKSYEENLSRTEREEGRAPTWSSRNVEEKTSVGLSRGREEYRSHDKDSGRHGEQLKRRERVEDEAYLQHKGSEDVYARGNQFGNEGKRSRRERSSGRNDHTLHASDNYRVHEKKHKDNSKKARESEGNSTLGSSKSRHGEKGVANEMGEVKGMSEQAEAEHDTSIHKLKHTRENRGDDDEQQGSKRGRSKLERWTSHKERDYDIGSKTSSSSLKIKEEISKDKDGGCRSFTSNSASTTKVEEEKVEVVDNNPLCLDADTKPPTGDRQLETVEKLKRRRERFKLPLTSDKDGGGVGIKKMEMEEESAEAALLASSENNNDTQSPLPVVVKQERPARKRRWMDH